MALVVSACADFGTTTNNDGGVTITRYASRDVAVEIPPRINGSP
jgi:hypothetical protein